MLHALYTIAPSGQACSESLVYPRGLGFIII